MKVITAKLTSVCLLTFVAAIPAHAAEKYDKGMEIIHFFANFPNGYAGLVTAVEKGAHGEALVRIRAPKQDPGSDPLRTISKECVLRWTRGDQPLPFVVGMRVEFSAQADGDVTAAMFGAELPYYRKRSDGLIEVLLHYEVSDGKKVWIRALPDRVNLSSAVGVGWSRQHGLVISIFEAGDGASEEESLRAGDKGLPVANVPGERVQIGHDGWKKNPDLSHERSKGVVPPRQYIFAGG
jgi:hypothetical protein